MTSILFGSAFLYLVVRLHYERDDTAVFRVLHVLNTYLRMLLLAIAVNILTI